MSIVLRTARPEDAPHVAGVLLSSRKMFLPYAPMAHTDSEFRQWVQEVLVPSNGVTVACAGLSIVGVIATSQEPSVRWINQLYVLPSHVGQGVGTQLLGHALASLALPVRLYTFQANVRARAFYERHGFEVVALSDGSTNEERCPDILFELSSQPLANGHDARFKRTCPERATEQSASRQSPSNTATRPATAP